MKNIYLFQKASEIKRKFFNFFRQKKKITALENYSQVVAFPHMDYLTLIKRCMQKGFLGETEADFLSYMIEKYFGDENYLNWTYKSKWLKQEMARLSAMNSKSEYIQPDLFDWDKINSSKGARVPIEVLAQHQRHDPMKARRA